VRVATTAVFAVIIWLASGISIADSPITTTRYFSSAVLKIHPARPTHEITAEEARSREAALQAYYIATYDDLGRLVSLEKRLRGKSFFHYTYSYTNGKAERTDIPWPPEE
jgi:hypothetical protein